MQRVSYIGLIILIIVSILSGTLTIYLAYNYIVERDVLQEKALANAEQQAIVAAEDISNAFGDVMIIAHNLADELSDGSLLYADIQDRMYEIVRQHPDIDGLAITFEPFVYDPAERLFQTYVFKVEDDSFDILVGATYDYTLRNDPNVDTLWYINTIDNGAQWHEPFFATGAQKVLVEYGVPFYPTNASDETVKPAGIVSIDYTLETVRNLVQELQLGGTGYGFVLSDQGTFLAHPVTEFVVNQSLPDLINNAELIQVAQNAQDGNRDFIEIQDPLTDARTWYFFESVGSTGWIIGIVLNPNQFLPDALQTIRDQMNIGLAVASTIFFVLTTIFHADHYAITNFWGASAVFSILCVLLIVLAWFLTNQLEIHSGTDITNKSELERFLQEIEMPLRTSHQPQKLPMGMLVQALQFPNPTSVTINGYIWQRYSSNLGEPPGFSLPQRIGEEATIEEIQRETTGEETLVVWYIGVTLRQTYDTIRFPFDHRNISIHIESGRPNENIILIPDLDAYDLLNPILLPGVNQNVSINNWTLQSSRFSFANNSAKVRVNLSATQDVIRLPQLQFNIQLQRVYLGPFIAYLLPGLVAAALSFVYLVSGRKAGNNDEILSALNYAAALFFVVAVIHSAMRERISAVSITYLEYIYILLYLAIIAVVANIFLIARFPNLFIVRYRDNLIFKVLYWPIFAGTMLIATLLIFIY